MKYRFTYIIVLICLIIACSDGAKASKEIPDEFKEGQKYFQKVCANCHGPEGIGQAGAPKLIQEKYDLKNFSNEKLTSTILMGSKSGKMPPQKLRVTEEQSKEIIKYIRYLQNK